MVLSPSTQRRTVHVEVHIDTLCAWSYLAKKSLEKAIDKFTNQYDDVDFEVIWRPYYTKPSLARGTKKSVLYQKEVDSRLLLDLIQDAGSEHGIQFRLDGTTGPSRNSHKLIALALEKRGPQVQSEVVERLFKGSFEEGEDPADTAWLVRVGTSCGLAEDDVRGVLGSRAATSSIDNEARAARVDRQVPVTPCVTIQGQLRILGYQGAELFDSAFEMLRCTL